MAWLAGRDDGHALVDEDRGVGHDPHDRGVRGEPVLDERGGDAGRGADDQAVGGDVRGEFVQELAHVLRLDREDEDVGVLGRLRVGDGLDPVPRVEFLGPVAPAGGHQEVGRSPARPDHPAEQGLADLAGAEDCDCLGHAFTLRAVLGCGLSSGSGRPPVILASGFSRRTAAEGDRAEAEDQQGASRDHGDVADEVAGDLGVVEDLVHAVDGVRHGQDVRDRLQDRVHRLARGEQAAEQELGEDHHAA